MVGCQVACCVFVSTMVVGIGYATLGHVDWALVDSLLIGSIPGIWLGAQLTTNCRKS